MMNLTVGGTDRERDGHDESNNWRDRQREGWA
jgi:hypothetical protein